MSLALTTRIPTPTGWRSLGNLLLGNFVFDENGQPTRVCAESPPWEGRPCYLLKFSDGTEAVTDHDHDWLVAAGALPERLVESRQIQHALGRRGPTPDFALPYPAPLEFGAFWPVGETPRTPYDVGRFGVDAAFIGASYMRAPVADRCEVLRGLIDGAGITGNDDPVCNCGEQRKEELRALEEVRRPRIMPGHLHKQGCPLRASFDGYPPAPRGLGYVELSTDAMPNGRFALDALELIRSLGYVARLGDGRIQFQAEPSKLARSRRYVLECEPCESVPVRAIQVENPSGLFLIERTLLPTRGMDLTA